MDLTYHSDTVFGFCIFPRCELCNEAKDSLMMPSASGPGDPSIQCANDRGFPARSESTSAAPPDGCQKIAHRGHGSRLVAFLPDPCRGPAKCRIP